MAKEKSEGADYYERMLGLLGSLTRLFSESNVPYLNYRVSENLFCKAFSAKNLSRSDVSADASMGNVGIGIKTFINGNGKSFQKVAEFNKDNLSFRGLDVNDVIKRVSELRNKRIGATKRIYGLADMIYHCVVRGDGKISAYECPMDSVNLDKIKDVVALKNTIAFKDDKNEYSFNLTKSTLYKRFITQGILFEVSVKILDDPFEILEQKFSDIKKTYYSDEKTKPFVILPLYSHKNGEKVVFEKSGLNQWNAGGRKRDYNEIYIPISKKYIEGFRDSFWVEIKSTI